MSNSSQVLGVKRLGVGDELTTEWVNSILDALDQLKVLSGGGVLVTNTPNGQLLRIKQAGAAGDSFVARFLVRQSGPGKVIVGTGAVVNTTNLPVTGLGAELTVTGNGGIYLTVNSPVSSATLAFAAAQPARSIRIASITGWNPEAQTFTLEQVVVWNIGVHKCGEELQWYASP